MIHYPADWLVSGGPPMDEFCTEDDTLTDESDWLRIQFVVGAVPHPWRVVCGSNNLVVAEGNTREMLEYLHTFMEACQRYIRGLEAEK